MSINLINQKIKTVNANIKDIETEICRLQKKRVELQKDLNVLVSERHDYYNFQKNIEYYKHLTKAC